MRSPTFRAPNIFHIIFLGFVFWFTTDLVSLVFRNGGPPPVVSYIGFLAFVLGAFIVRITQGRSAINIASWHQSRSVWLWLFFFLEWNQVNFLYSSQSAVALQSLITRVEMTLVFMAFLWFFSSQNIKRNIGLVMVAVAVFGSVVNINDFFHPLFSAVPGRAAGLYENPNTSGFILIMAMSSGMAAIPISLRWPFLILLSSAILLTFSRASWLVLGISLLWFAWQGYLGGKAMRFLLFGLAGFGVAFLMITMLSGTLAELIAASPIGNYLDANTMARLGGSEFATDYSANERRAVAQLAISAFLDGHNPIFGYGLGHTFEWEMNVSTHNLYLLFLVEGGLFGVAIYLCLLGVLWRSASGIGRLVVLQIAIHSFFDHNLLDSPGRIIFLAMVAAGVLNFGKKHNTVQSEMASIGNPPSPHHGPQHRRGRAFFA